MSKAVLLVFVVVFLEIPVSNGISCYVCEETTSKQTCMSGEHLVHDRLHGGLFIRNCTRSQYCLIEAIINAGGAYVSFMRTCTNGDYAGSKVPRLAENVTPNNETQCAYDQLSGLKFCVALCKTDHCNGPQLHSSSSAGGTGGFTVLYSGLALMMHRFLNLL